MQNSVTRMKAIRARTSLARRTAHLPPREVLQNRVLRPSGCVRSNEARGRIGVIAPLLAAGLGTVGRTETACKTAKDGTAPCGRGSMLPLGYQGLTDMSCGMNGDDDVS